eukprot:364259-Chlamydomonas_euryale.AAC.14
MKGVGGPSGDRQRPSRRRPVAHCCCGRGDEVKLLEERAPRGMGSMRSDESESESTGRGPTRGMPVLGAARQRGSSSGLGAVTPLRSHVRGISLANPKLAKKTASVS